MDSRTLYNNTTVVEEAQPLDLHDPYATENMDFSPDHRLHMQEELEHSMWEQHRRLQDLPEEISQASNSPESIPLEGVLLAECREDKPRPRFRSESAAAIFTNPFYQAEPRYERPEMATVDPPPVNAPPSRERADHMYLEWSHYNTNQTVPPGRYLNAAASHHQRALDGVYQDIGAQISRRFSLACPPGGGFELPIPGHPRGDGNAVKFVMEDPSGKENSRNESLITNGDHHGRRHSMGTPHLYCCPWTGCNKVFNRFYNLRSHYRIHSGEKPFTCNYCEAAFARNHDLKRHERIHSKAKPYVCPTCHKAFSRNDAMNRHIRLNSCTRAVD